MSEPTYTIAQIRRYLEGWHYRAVDSVHAATWNHALNNAINELADDDDGIEAVTRRAEPKMKESVDP